MCRGAHIHRMLADVCTEAELFKSFAKETLMGIDAYLLIFKTMYVEARGQLLSCGPWGLSSGIRPGDKHHYPPSLWQPQFLKKVIFISDGFNFDIKCLYMPYLVSITFCCLCESHPFFSLLFKKIFRLFFLNNLECIPVWPITGCVAQASFRLSILLH